MRVMVVVSVGKRMALFRAEIAILDCLPSLRVGSLARQPLAQPFVALSLLQHPQIHALNGGLGVRAHSPVEQGHKLAIAYQTLKQVAHLAYDVKLENALTFDHARLNLPDTMPRRKRQQ